MLHCMSFVGSIPQVSFKIQSLEKAPDDITVKTGSSDISGDHIITFENGVTVCHHVTDSRRCTAADRRICVV